MYYNFKLKYLGAGVELRETITKQNCERTVLLKKK